MTQLDCMKMSRQTLVLFLAAATLAILTGCRTQPKPPLLGDRGIVPPAYSSTTGETVTRPAREPFPEIPDDEGLEPLMPLEPEPTIDEPLVTEAPIEEPSDAFEMPPAVESKAETYTVKKGDSLWKIARAYGITHQELAAYNNMDADETLKVDDVLQIPPSASFVPPEERGPAPRAGTATRVPEGGQTYTVQKGDSLWKIANRYNVKLSELKALNNLAEPDRLVPGQKLVLPASAQATTQAARTPTRAREPEPEEPALDELAPPTPPVDETEPEPPEPTVEQGATPRPEPIPPTTDRVALPNLLDHTVLEDDTLKSIADMYGTTIEKIKEANPTIKSDEDLIPNMKILVPID